jgi:hypothetical protein
MNTETYAETAMLRFECDHCGALAGQWCTTKLGARASMLHAARYYRWRKQGQANGE